jgi:hypothetical protein
MRFPIIQADGVPLMLKADGDSAWYGLGLELVLDGETIAAAPWTVPTGLTKVTETVSVADETHEDVSYPAATLAKVRLSGGTAGTKYRCSVVVTSSGGQVFERSLDIIVRATL